MAKTTIIEELILSHWSVAALLSVTIYILAVFILPQISFDHTIHQAIATAVSKIAPWLSLIFALCAVVSFFRKQWQSRTRKKLFDNHQSCDAIESLDWQQMERWSAQLFAQEGYSVKENHSKGPDGGVDLTLNRDKQITLVQCKHWTKGAVPVSVVRELLGVVVSNKAHAGILVSSGSVTKPARMFAQQNHIRIIDGRRLQQMLKHSKSTRPATPAKPTLSSPDCPRCAKPMLLRTAKKGPHSGKQFFGCSSFPACKEIISLSA